MKISTDWLKDFVDLKPPIPDHALALTEAGLEVEAIEKSASGDTVFQVEVTTNRPDWLSHWGVARELSAIHGSSLAKPKIADEKKISRTPPPGWKIISKDLEACSYYTGVLIEGISERKIPEFIQRRLESCGLRSINLIVDITNYVLLELGQPLHAFDADVLAGQQIVVRRARKDEKLTAISGAVLNLAEQDLVIADSEKALALAGVMGGKDSEITTNSRNVFLEAAHFQPRMVRDSARRHQLSTDSSYRFERRVDPFLVDLARLRALYLIQEYAKPRHVSGVIQAGQKPNPVLTTLHLSEDFVNSTLGSEIKTNQISSALNRLGLDVKTVSPKTWKVAIPSFRADLTRPIDLVEEVARLYGFSNIQEKLPILIPGAVSIRPERLIQKHLREIMVGAGFNETVTFSLISGQGLSEDNLASMVRLKNPLQAGLEWMRPALLPSLLQVVHNNLRHGADEIALFEIANVYQREGKEVTEEKSIGFVLTGKVQSGKWLDKAREASYFDLKGLMQRIFLKAGITGVSWEKEDVLGLMPSVSEKIRAGKKEIGYAGQVSPAWMKIWDIQVPVFYGEIRIAALTADMSRKVYKDIPKYPAMERDLSMMVPEQVYCGQVIQDIQSAGGQLVQDIQLFDLFQGGRIPKGYKNFSYRLTYISPERTLTAEEIDALHSKIAQILATKYQAQFQSH